MNPENFTWQLMARSLSGEATEEEVRLLFDALKKDEALQQQYDILKQFWMVSAIPQKSNEDYEKNISAVLEKSKVRGLLYRNERANRLAKSRKKRRLAIFAGSIAFLIFLSAGFYFLNNKPVVAKNNKLSQLVVNNGDRKHTILPDGSSVWLNGGSTLYYTSDFSGKTREVYLKGEAFFDVVKNPGRPFIVHANSVDIKVLGTAFNVRSYIDDNKVEATLIRGVIQVLRPGLKNQKPVFLHPNEKLVINLDENKPVAITSDNRITVKPVTYKLYHLDSSVKTENRVETSWMFNRLEFRGDNFSELAKKLEHWYNIKIVFEDSAVEKLNFNGSFENETVDQAFAALKTAAQFDYVISGDEVFVRSGEETGR